MEETSADSGAEQSGISATVRSGVRAFPVPATGASA